MADQRVNCYVYEWVYYESRLNSRFGVVLLVHRMYYIIVHCGTIISSMKKPRVRIRKRVSKVKIFDGGGDSKVRRSEVREHQQLV